MSKTSTFLGIATGVGIAVYVAAGTALLVAARLADVGEEQAYHSDRTEAAVRQIHRSLMQCPNYRGLFAEERAKEIEDIASLVVKAMIKQIDPLYQQDALDHALNNIVHFCSEELP